MVRPFFHQSESIVKWSYPGLVDTHLLYISLEERKSVVPQTHPPHGRRPGAILGQCPESARGGREQAEQRRRA